MKIKKTYTHARVGLLVGLFSFHTLYSCVHTGRELGMGLLQSKENKEIKKVKKEIKQMKYTGQADSFLPKPEHSSFSCAKSLCYNSKKPVWCVAKVGGYLALAGTVGYIIYYKYGNMLSPSTPTENTLTNTTVSGNATMTALESNLALLGGVANTTVSAIGSTMKDVVTTVVPIGIGLLNGTAIAGGLLNANRSNVHDNSSSVTTTTPLTPTDKGAKNIPSKSTPKSSNTKPIALTREVISDIRAHEFSISRMKYWHKKGLPIDAADPEEGRTLLIEAVNLNLLAQVKWLRINGANLDATDNRANTALMYAIHNANKAEGKAKTEAKVIIDYLLKHGATPCTKNVDGRPLNADIKPLNNKGLSDAFEKC